MRLRNFFVLVLVFVLPLLAVSAYADTPNIGSAGPFAVLGEAGVTNIGPSTIFGSVAGSSGTPSVTGFTFSTSPGPGMVIAPGVGITVGVANSGLGTPFGDALNAFNTAYNFAGSLGGFNPEGTSNLGAGGIGSSVAVALTPGAYSFTNATVLLGGTLFLNAGGSNAANWTFMMPAALTVTGGTTVQIVNAGAAGAFTGSITWLSEDVTFTGSPSAVLGTFITTGANLNDTLTNGDTIGCGRVISLDASVTLINNTISTGCTVTAGAGGGGGTITPPTPHVPEPGTFGLLSSGLLAMVFLTFRKSRASSLSLSC